MNLLQIRTAFVQKSGYYDLVVDTTDYVDNGANFFIQAGQRFLDTVVPNRKALGRYVATIVENQSSLLLKKVRSIDSVYIKGSGEGRSYLDRKAYSWLIENYGDDFGEKAKGVGTVSDVPSDDEILTIDEEVYTFKDSPSSTNDVEIGDTASETIANLVSKINTNSSVAKAYQLTASTFLIEYILVGTAGNEIVFTTDAGNISLDGSGLLGGTVAGRTNEIGTGAPTYYSPIISNPHPDLSVSNLTAEDTHDLMFGYDRFAYDGILFMKPADASYTMTIFGSFFSQMILDPDVSYHSELYPELLIMAASMARECFFRNTQGVQDWIGSMQLWLKGIDHDLVREEIALAGTQLKG